MKNLGIILGFGITAPILILVGIYLLWLQEASPQPAFVISINDDVAGVKATLSEKEAIVQTQLDGLSTAFQQQQTHFNEQTEKRQNEIDRAEAELASLDSQIFTLESEIARLEITQTVRLNSYQTELTQTRQQFKTRLAELETQLEAAQTQLADIEIRLNKP